MVSKTTAERAGIKKGLADAALGAATAAGATYCDVRVGRYLRQFVITREANVQNIVNTESSGVGVRVIANGAWGFAATNTMTTDAVAQASGRPPADLKDAKRRGMAVHGRRGEACPVCGDEVRSVFFADNSLEYCPTCQTGGKLLADRRLSRLLK